ncbi:MAG: class I SAM-dependent methyltransferase [Sterolibacteriaceae bacterium MAG5]|nr:class I SAM-dependent methyltransferase [Candidatus Nitricoxidireducens bremensis]
MPGDEVRSLVAKLISDRTLSSFGSWTVFGRKVVNTFCQLPFLWPWVIRDIDYARIMSGTTKISFLKRVALKVVWFWPRIIEANLWVKGAKGARKDPSHFVQIDQSTTDTIRLIGEIIGDRSQSILDVGCNSGRHLYLFQKLGFDRLHGFEAMGAAFETFRTRFPDTYRVATLHHGLWQQLLKESPTCHYDVVFTWGATIETVHPSFPIVRELSRVSRNIVVCVINEHDHHPRFWTYQFAKAGFDLIFAIRPLGDEANAVTDTDSKSAYTTSLLVYKRAKQVD